MVHAHHVLLDSDLLIHLVPALNALPSISALDQPIVCHANSPMDASHAHRVLVIVPVVQLENHSLALVAQRVVTQPGVQEGRPHNAIHVSKEVDARVAHKQMVIAQVVQKGTSLLEQDALFLLTMRL